MILLALLLAAPPPPIPTAPPSPTDIAASAPPSAWRPIPPENLLLLETPRGTLAIELAPDFAPAHIAAIKSLIAQGRFNGGNITRVQDNYVVQWAARPAPQGTPKPAPLPAEYERPAAGLTITPLGNPDTYAEAGFANGWPVAQDKTTNTAWLAHCYAAVGVGRDNPPDTGDGSELYAVIGHAPRHLDRNITVVGRVVEGLPAYASLPRGTGDIGFYKTPAEYTPITRVRLAANIPGAPRFEVMDTTSKTFADYKAARANRTGFFIRPAAAVDLCNVQVPVRRAK
ncbi:peptidyl-prolyl cis-trans isomerase [Polymorphobacter glacialis]|uniref:Peptidyl-prolyl cis-trans isomerase n=1 Tax=Sandarakinorhabdus glacialis TaxID=1614636 RepID=A0A917E408_9SPHN|nr:peptidylprolyl isomerase [Polymorphobacter glacialis]GGD98963.1 peptidyl-prolyl cis-trans isomerase [Polymorphobacter glacialis]